MGANNTVSYKPKDGLDDLAYEFKISLSVVQICFCMLGTGGNILTIMAVILAKSLHRIHNIYIAHLAGVDLVINAFLIPTNIYGLEHGRPSNCTAIGALSLICLVASILSLMMIALNRYILICKNSATYAKFYNRKTIVFSMLLIWVYASVITLPMLSFNALNWNHKTWYCFFINYDFVTYLYISISMASLGVVAPAVITATCYTLIMRRMRASNKALLMPTPATTGSTISATSTSVCN